MGNILGFLRKPQDFNQNITSMLDFENVEPTQEETEMYNLVKNEFHPSANVMKLIKEYEGADQSLKKLMTDTNDENAIKQIWQTLNPLIKLLKMSYELSKQMEVFLPKLLVSLCDGKNPVAGFENKQALAELFSRILDFSMEFDLAKINKPAIINDFTFYKRTIGKSTTSSDGFNLVIDNVQGEIISKIGLFISTSYPYMHLISKVTINHFSGGSAPTLKEITDSLATLARLCKYMVETPSVYNKFQNKETKIFCTRVMVSLIVLYDNVHSEGIFVKTPLMDIKAYAKFLREQEDGVQLLHIIKHLSKHFNKLPMNSAARDIFK